MTTIDGVLKLTENAGYVVLDEMPQSFTIEADITIAGPGTLFRIYSDSGIYDSMQIWLYQIPGGGYKLAWSTSGTDSNGIPKGDQFEVQYVNGHSTLAFSYESTGIARIYSNGSLMRTYTFVVAPTLTKLHFGDPSRPGAYTALCYLDEFTVYDYAFTGTTSEEPDLVADFSANVTSGAAPLAVQFTDKSTSKNGKIVSWLWDFGDSNTSTESYPSNTFASDGMYHVSLTVKDQVGTTDTETKQFYIKVTGTLAEITSEFIADVVKGEPPLTVYFEDCSQSPNNLIAWQWCFDYDNYPQIIDSTLQNASHTYTEEGIYSVSLKVVDSTFDYDTNLKRQYIWCQETDDLPPVANFSYSNIEAKTQGGTVDWEFLPALPITVEVNQGVYFSDLSSYMNLSQHPHTWSWNFGDGETLEYDDTNHHNGPVVHTYTSSGTYDVSLTVTNVYGSDSVTQSPCIVVITGDCKPPAPAFSCNAGYGYIYPVYQRYADINETIQFTDLSLRLPSSWKWDFGDNTSSSLQHPTHSYNRAGMFDVTLYAENECGGAYLTKQNYIVVSGSCTADFISDVTTTSGNYVQFYDRSSGDITKWYWNFGDGTYSYEQNPGHVYPENYTKLNKTYTVSLTVYSGSTSDRETKTNYITLESVEYEDDDPYPPTLGTLFLDSRSGHVEFTVNIIFTNISNYINSTYTYRVLWGDEETGLSYVPWSNAPLTHTYTSPGIFSAILQIVNKNTGTILIQLLNTVNVYAASDNNNGDNQIIIPNPVSLDTCTADYYTSANIDVEYDTDLFNNVYPHTYYTGKHAKLVINYSVPTCAREVTSGGYTIAERYYSIFSATSSSLQEIPFALSLIYDRQTNSIIFEHVERNSRYRFHTPNTGEITVYYSVRTPLDDNHGKTGLPSDTYDSSSMQVTVGGIFQQCYLYLGQDDPVLSLPIPSTTIPINCAPVYPYKYYISDRFNSYNSEWGLISSYNIGYKLYSDATHNNTWFTPLSRWFLGGTKVTRFEMSYERSTLDDDGVVDVEVSSTAASNSPPLTTGFTLSNVPYYDENYTIEWDWGDNSSTVTQGLQPNMEHTYTESGNYTLTVTISRIDGVEKVITKENIVKIGDNTEDTITAYFSVDNINSSFYLNGDIYFTDTSASLQSITSRIWNFGDGTIEQTSQTTVKHRYTKCGVFTVSLTVSNGSTSDVETKTNYISISSIQTVPLTPQVFQSFDSSDLRVSNSTRLTPRGIIAYNLVDKWNNLYTDQCFGNYDRENANQSIIHFNDKNDSYAILILPYNTEVTSFKNSDGETIYNNILFTNFGKCFSVAVEFIIRECDTDDNYGTILCSYGDYIENDETSFSVNVVKCTDDKIRISFDQMNPEVPTSLSDFILCPGQTYEVIFIFQSNDYYNKTVTSPCDCGSYAETTFINITPEMRSYIKVNDRYYLLGKYELSISTTEFDKAICLGGAPGTLGAAKTIDYSSVKTYNYPIDKNYTGYIKPEPSVTPITNYKDSNPTLYNYYINLDFDNCTSSEADLTLRYMGTGIYTTEDTYLTNLPLTGTITDEEFGLLLSNGDLTFATYNQSCDCTFFGWSYAFYNVGLGDHQNYLIMAIDNKKSGTETLTSSLVSFPYEFYKSITKSYVTYRDLTTGTDVPIKLMIIRYPVSSRSGNYIFNYLCTFDK